MQLSLEDYRRKVLGCWMGKNIGGTLGAPFEFFRQVNNVSFYTQDLGGEPLPNDDLDIQLLWLIAMEERGLDLSAATLAEYWCLYVTPHWSEYGTAKLNMRTGLLPPLSGTMHNEYKDSCGAFIRSEIWACVAPGCPDVAARMALEDAILDHGNGEGTYGEIFCAALESAAFVISDLRTLIDIGLSYIPAESGMAKAIRTAVQCADRKMPWREARDEILRLHRGSALFKWPSRVSKEDQAKGFVEGQRGYDAPSNVALTVLGLLVGGNDFDKVMCTTVNCGEDTDCTGATAGSIFGIIHGFDAIPKKWIEPIGQRIKTMCLNLGELGHFGSQVPQTIEDLTDRTERLALRVLQAQGPRCLMKLVEGGATQLADADPAKLKAADAGASLFRWLGGTRHRFDFFTVDVDYGADASIRDGQEKTVTVRIHNTYKVHANIALHWYLPDGWQVSPSRDGFVMVLPPVLGPSPECRFTFRADRVTQPTNRAVLELTCPGRPTVMLVPVVFQNGNTPSLAKE
jgi:ADP-ribosylglycohydrolase